MGPVNSITLHNYNLPLTTIQTWAQQNAPFVVFDSKEKFFPSPIEWFFQHKCVHSYINNILLQNILPSKKCIYDYTDIDPIFYGIKFNQPEDIPMYYIFTPLPHSNKAVISYHIFSPLSGPIPFFLNYPLPPAIHFLYCLYQDHAPNCQVSAHAGEWEGMSMIGNYNQTHFTPTTLYYYAHGHKYSTKLPAKEAEYFLDQDGNNHPYIYSGLYTHPSFPHRPEGYTWSLDENDGKGKRWETWHNIINIMTLETEIPWSAWGEYDFGWNIHSPIGPTVDLSWVDYDD